METTQFDDRMSKIHHTFQDGGYERAGLLAAALREALMAETIVSAEQVAWPLYYQLRSLHAANEWRALVECMTEHGAFMAAAGPTNHSYVCSLTMEACYHLGDAGGVARWALAACRLRAGRDPESFDMALASATGLLERMNRRDVLADLLEQLCDYLSHHDHGLVVGEVQARLLDLIAEHPDERLASAALQRAIDCGAPMFAAASAGNLDQTLAILDDIGDTNLVDPFGRTALSAAAFAGHEQLVHALLRRPGIDIDRPNRQKRTALALAADQGHAAIVHLLLDAGASPDIADFNQQTPLILAAWQNHAPVIQDLIAAGANTEHRDRTGNTALHLAATEDATDAVAALVTGGADVHARTDLDHTPLMKAAMEGKAANVEVLLAAGANPKHCDAYGMTAQSWAEQEGFADLAARL